MGLGWQFFGLQTYVIIGRPRFEDQTLATWHRGSGIRMGWWPSSRCPLEMGQLGHLRPMGTYGHLWAPMGTFKMDNFGSSNSTWPWTLFNRVF
jgi:hypothetical protein